MLIKQVNRTIKFYQELQAFVRQKYGLQIHHLKNAQNKLEISQLVFSGSIFQQAKTRLQKSLKIALNELECFKKIKSLQKSFSNKSSLEGKKHTLQELQETIQNLGKIRPLNDSESQIQSKVRKNLGLIQNKNFANSLTSLLPVINLVPQTSLPLITIENSSTSENTSPDQNLTPDLQKGIIILIIFFLLSILVWK